MDKGVSEQRGRGNAGEGVRFEFSYSKMEG